MRRRINAWVDHCVWFRLALIFKRFENPERFNRLLSGVHALFWWKFCGYDWAEAFRMARISWSYLPGFSWLRPSFPPFPPVQTASPHE